MSEAPLYVSINLAYLPGVGAIENPDPQHYAWAINHLAAEVRARPRGHPPPTYVSSLKSMDPRIVLAEALSVTLRRIVWTRAQREGAV